MFVINLALSIAAVAASTLTGPTSTSRRPRFRIRWRASRPLYHSIWSSMADQNCPAYTRQVRIHGIIVCNNWTSSNMNILTDEIESAFPNSSVIVRIRVQSDVLTAQQVYHWFSEDIFDA